MRPKSAAQRRLALLRRFWKTGSNSPGDELMTRNTSDVAVCCSNDSRNSFSSRVFSMAMTAWSAKVFDQFDLLIGKSLYGRPTENEDANRPSFA